MGTLGSNRITGGVSDAVGVRFHPTPEEMVDHYLRLKKRDKDFKSDHIAEFDVCNFDPRDLAARIPSDDMVWYFFSRKEYKYVNSTRSNRTTPGGQWRITGKERPVKARRSKAVIGKKRTLTFYRRCGPQRKLRKTNWVRHEYSLVDSEAISDPKLRQEDFVLNRMKKEFDDEDSIGEVELGSYSVSDVEDHAAAVVTPESQDYSFSTFLSSGYIEPGDVLQANGTSIDCNAIQSPFGDNHYSYTDKNDISTCDKGDWFTMSDFENEPPNDMCQEPRVGDFYSHVTYKNNISTNDENEAVSYTAYDENQYADDMIQEPSYLQPEKYARSVLDADVCNNGYNNWQPQVWNKDSYLTDKNNISTNNGCEQFSNTHFNFENQATNKRISKVCLPQEENLELAFYLPQLEDYTLEPPMNKKVGDVLHDNNYIACNEFQSPI